MEKMWSLVSRLIRRNESRSLKCLESLISGSKNGEKDHLTRISAYKHCHFEVKRLAHLLTEEGVPSNMSSSILV